ncbi:MAG: J domain-containing protein [Bacteroidetes bacterium]|nr:J domain-containing protein [Bacteroidota bacterium]
MKDYYSILGVSSTASDTVIKRQYRQLALRYHPDKNSSAEAALIIQEINEAYDVLGDPQKRQQYDMLLSGQYLVVTPEPEPAAPRHRDPRYRPKSAEYMREVRENSVNAYMRDNLRYMVLVSKFTMVFALFCMLDFALPTVKNTHQITSTSKTANDQNVRGSFILYLDDGTSVSLSHELDEVFLDGDKVDYYNSMILSIPVKIENQRNHYLTRVPLSYFGNFLFFPIVLLATSALGVFYSGEGVEFRFNVGLFNLIFFLFNLYFLNVHR